MKALTQREIEVLRELKAASLNVMQYPIRNMHKEGWVMPMNCGGRNGSHHSYTLTKLSKLGLCDRVKFGGKHEKGSCRYRINSLGKKKIQELGTS